MPSTGYKVAFYLPKLFNKIVADFQFIQNKINGKWVISAPRRSHRTNTPGNTAHVCPFCPGNESEEEELFRIGGKGQDDKWQIRVLPNKFPFAPNHEIIIHSPDHHKNFDELPFSQVDLIFKTYRQRYSIHKKTGYIYIFHNSGPSAGASIAHPHTQLVVIPQNVKLDITPLDPEIYKKTSENKSSIFQVPFSNDFPFSIDQPKTRAINGRWTMDDGQLETEHFLVFCPPTSEWPDEVWIAPKQNGGGFGFIKDPEIVDISFVLARLIQIFDLRHGHEFPYNFYIPPLKNWYLRLIPRQKILGGFELGTNINVNTQDPSETFKFIKEHFWHPDHEKIRNEHQAGYQDKV